MYATHASAIQNHVASAGAPAFRDVGLFVLATIRVPLWAAAASTRAILAGGDDAKEAFRRVVWGHKREGLAFLDANASELLRDAYWCVERGDDVQLLDLLAHVPGLGLAKAGFLAQLAFGRVGCLDTHNLRRFGLDVNMCGIPAKLPPAARVSRVDAYLAACEAAGGCAALWDGWCHYVAATQAKRYSDAYHVSALHCAALGLPL